jgi:hypothetical protein
MSYTTYIWKESDRTLLESFRQWKHAGAGDYTARAGITPLESMVQIYYAGMTGQHIEARLVAPKLGWNRDSVELLWSKTYDSLKAASTVENECIGLLSGKAKMTAWAACDNQNANNRGWCCESEWPKYISGDLSKVEKIIDKSLALTAALVPKAHKESSQQLIKETQREAFAEMKSNAERLTKDNKAIQDLLAQYVEEHHPKIKRGGGKAQWNIANIKSAIKTLERTLSAYKTN